MTTVVVYLILVISLRITNKTNKSLLVDPIETMIKKVQNISKNPVRAAHQEEDEQFTKEE